MQSDSKSVQRRAGILLHISSLPGAEDHGDLGKQSYRFVDFLKTAGISVWQTLPLGMPHDDGSPYQCLSAHAGNPMFICPDMLVEKGWVSDIDSFRDSCSGAVYRKACLNAAWAEFLKKGDAADKIDFVRFCKDRSWWLDDFALFVSLREEFEHKCWSDWPRLFRNKDAKSLQEAEKRLAGEINKVKFFQFLFFRQWQDLREYAHRRGVLMFGDIPIFVSYDSADVWAQRENFKLDENGAMTVVAGVPPDYFSETGQRWGNPHYNWEYLQNNRFQWWIERFRTLQELFDIIRIDHFRGLQAAWEIPASEETAIKGEWVKAPGEELLSRIEQEFGDRIALVAEDLGIITPEVEALRDKFGLPGMKILQFAFDGGPDNPYLPQNYVENCVVYTGTHDNDTTLGWFESLSEEKKHYVYQALGNPQLPMPQALVHAALASIANLAVIPMQDILELGSEHRMNTPGTMGGNWQWRFRWSQLADDKVQKLSAMLDETGRKTNGTPLNFPRENVDQ
ncbi:4-alpha-glucanotransferase [Thiolapillus sp.]|uniref:4-alpha-glucanotransferase n=1 Tax=Thiolapillus sp. TaxID=2017437 RepID=UPI003AF88B42